MFHFNYNIRLDGTVSNGEVQRRFIIGGGGVLVAGFFKIHMKSSRNLIDVPHLLQYLIRSIMARSVLEKSNMDSLLGG